MNPKSLYFLLQLCYDQFACFNNHGANFGSIGFCLFIFFNQRIWGPMNAYSAERKMIRL